MDDHVSGEDHRRTLVWLDSSLEWARAKDRTGLEKLLNLVRTEVLFDVNSSESAFLARGRVTVDRPAFDMNRNI